MYISRSINRLEFLPRMVPRRFLRILPISTHYHVNIFIVVVVVEIKLNRKFSFIRFSGEESSRIY